MFVPELGYVTQRCGPCKTSARTADYTPAMLTPGRAIVGIAALATVLLTLDDAAAKKDSLRQWLDGPVHYIITPDELKEFKALKTDPERAAFVERFWRKRDPTPSTLANEYRQFFWDRVREADEKFLDSAGPGWQTDRGKIYILYGPPDEVQDDPNATPGTGDVGDGKGVIRWIYTKPGGRRDVDPVVYVPFVRDVSGQYRLSNDPKLASPFFTMMQLDDNRTVGYGSFLTQIQHSVDPIGVMLDMGKMQEVPPQETFILDSVDTVETYAFEPLTLSIQRFQPPGKEFLAVVTVSIPGPASVDPPSVLARFSRKGSTKDAHVLGEGSFRADGEGEDRVTQGRVLLEPGAWEVTALAVEPASGVSRIFKGHFDAPPAGSALRLSDIALARQMEPLRYAAQASYDAPYIVGGFRVVPRPVTSIRRGTPVQTFFEIYGGAPPFHLAYQLEGQEKDGRWRALGPPQQSDATERGQGFALPTGAAWPVGAYRLKVAVTDAASAAASGEIGWTLLADAAP